jgi:hypothetical protein
MPLLVPTMRIFFEGSKISSFEERADEAPSGVLAIKVILVDAETVLLEVNEVKARNM